MAWSNTAVHQDLKSSGKYSSASALAKEYAGLKEDGGSRVDDGEGWREIKRDTPPKNAAEYAELVKEYAAAGFDVKAIDMDGDDFTHSNIAIKPSNMSDSAEPEKPIGHSPTLAHAKARVAQYEEDIHSGKYSSDLYDMDYKPTGADSFLNRYKMKLGEKLENGLYLDPQDKQRYDTEKAEFENQTNDNNLNNDPNHTVEKANKGIYL